MRGLRGYKTDCLLGLTMALLLAPGALLAQAPRTEPALAATEAVVGVVEIATIEVRGVTALGAAQVVGATRPWIGKPLTAETAGAVIGAIEALYRAAGRPAARARFAGEDRARAALLIDVLERPGPTARPPETPLAAPAVERFALRAFELVGAKVVAASELQERVARHLGPQRDFGDLQRAIDDIEAVYRARGYSAVVVTLPEQDITRGTVRIEIIEAPLGKVDIRGATRYSAANLRRALPALREGQTPNAAEISQSVQLANDNPARQVEVVLAVGERENTVDARVEVKEDLPRRVYFTADNSGTPSTGDARVGLAYVAGDLFDLDHTATLSFTTSPDAPSGVDMNVYSASYRVPFYTLGDSLTFLYGYSDVYTPAFQTTALAINGKGSVAALRWNFNRPRDGEFSSQVIAGLDWKNLASTCTTVSGQQTNNVAGCVDYEVMPLSLGWSGRRDGVTVAYDYSLTLVRNLATGKRYDWQIDGDSGSDRYTLAAGNRRAQDNFSLLRFGGSHTAALGQWLSRIALNGQYAFDSALVSSEQFGLTGAQAVRGFLDRVVIADSGAVINLELHSPELAPLLGLDGHNLRALAFFDYGRGRDHETIDQADKTLSSAGLGLRYQFGKSAGLRVDAARLLRSDPANIHQGADPRSANGLLDDNVEGDWRAHVALTLSF